jgi:hypothetical protein
VPIRVRKVYLSKAPWADSRRNATVGFQHLWLLLGFVKIGVESPGKLGSVSSTLRLGCVSSASPTCWAGEFWPWIVRPGLLFSVGSRSYRSARPCCMSQAILLKSTVQDVISC